MDILEAKVPEDNPWGKGQIDVEEKTLATTEAKPIQILQELTAVLPQPWLVSQLPLLG